MDAEATRRSDGDGAAHSFSVNSSEPLSAVSRRQRAAMVTITEPEESKEPIPPRSPPPWTGFNSDFKFGDAAGAEVADDDRVDTNSSGGGSDGSELADWKKSVPDFGERRATIFDNEMVEDLTVFEDMDRCRIFLAREAKRKAADVGKPCVFFPGNTIEGVVVASATFWRSKAPDFTLSLVYECVEKRNGIVFYKSIVQLPRTPEEPTVTGASPIEEQDAIPAVSKYPFAVDIPLGVPPTFLPDAVPRSDALNEVRPIDFEIQHRLTLQGCAASSVAVEEVDAVPVVVVQPVSDDFVGEYQEGSLSIESKSCFCLKSDSRMATIKVLKGGIAGGRVTLLSLIDNKEGLGDVEMITAALMQRVAIDLGVVPSSNMSSVSSNGGGNGPHGGKGAGSPSSPAPSLAGSNGKRRRLKAYTTCLSRDTVRQRVTKGSRDRMPKMQLAIPPNVFPSFSSPFLTSEFFVEVGVGLSWTSDPYEMFPLKVGHCPLYISEELSSPTLERIGDIQESMWKLPERPIVMMDVDAAENGQKAAEQKGKASKGDRHLDNRVPLPAHSWLPSYLNGQQSTLPAALKREDILPSNLYQKLAWREGLGQVEVRMVREM